MSHSVIHTQSVNDGIETRNHRATITGGAKRLIDESIPGASTNLQLLITVDISALKFVELGCEDRAIVIKTNSSGSPQETFSLDAGEFIVWSVDDPSAACPFAGDVTSIYVTLAAGAAADLTGVILEDPTP